MSFRPDLRPPMQDMPPPGGFPMTDAFKTTRARGPTGLQIWMVSSLAIVWGMYRCGQYNRQQSAEKLEERKTRYAMAAILQAEEDRWYTERENEILAREAEIMKNVPGWKVGESVYLTKRWVPRDLAQLDKNMKK